MVADAFWRMQVGQPWCLGENLELLVSRHALRVPGAGKPLLGMSEWGKEFQLPWSVLTGVCSQRKGRSLGEIQACLLRAPVAEQNERGFPLNEPVWKE